MKRGANFVDVNRIKALEADGCGVDEISVRLKIHTDTVASFMKPDKPKRKRKASAEAVEVIEAAAADVVEAAAIEALELGDTSLFNDDEVTYAS